MPISGGWSKELTLSEDSPHVTMQRRRRRRRRTTTTLSCAIWAHSPLQSKEPKHSQSKLSLSPSLSPPLFPSLSLSLSLSLSRGWTLAHRSWRTGKDLLRGKPVLLVDKPVQADPTSDAKRQRTTQNRHRIFLASFDENSASESHKRENEGENDTAD